MALQVWLPLNGDLKNKGCADVTFTQANLTYTSGKIGQCAYFNNIKTNTVTIPALSGATKFSMATWIKIPSNQTITNWADVMTFGCSSGSSTSTFRLEQTTSGSSLCWFANGILTNDGGVGYYPSNLRNDTWYHLAVTCDGQKMYRYWNGTLHGEFEIPSGFIGNYLTGTMSIGDTGNYCYLNDIRVYNHCLSAAEVKEISRGLVLHYKLDDPYIESTINYGRMWENISVISEIASDWKLEKLDRDTLKITALVDNPGYSTWGNIVTNIAGSVTVTAGTACTLSCEIVDFKGSLSRLYPCSGGFGSIVGYGTYDNRVYRTITHTVDWGHNICIRTSDQSNIVAGDYLIIKNTQIEVKDHPTPYTETSRNESVVPDSSGCGNNGILRETVNISNNTARYNACVTFNGSSNNITSSFPSFGTEVSFALWVKFTKVGVHLLDCRNASGIGYQPMWISSSGVQIGGTGNSFPTINYSFNTNVWYHIVVTHDSSKGCLYINGVKIGESTAAAGYNYSQDLPVHLGSRYSSENWFGGDISDFRIYETTLSAEDIKQLYEVSEKIDNLGGIHSYEFVEKPNSSPKLLKTGVTIGSGNPNANIVPNTFFEERTYQYPTGSNYSDKWSATTTIVPSATQYVLSFWAKSTVNGDKIRTHYYNPNTTTTCESSQGIIHSASDGSMDFTLSTEWQFYWVVYTQTETTSVKRLIVPRLGNPNSDNTYYTNMSGSGTVSIKMIKFEEGNIPTVWIPNAADDNYFNTVGFVEKDGNCKIQKKGYFETSELIEM